MSKYRKYSVHEIDALRTVVKQKYIFGTYRTSRIGRSSRQYKEDVMVKTVEEMVRTHMLAGHTADDLISSESDTTSKMDPARTRPIGTITD